MSRGFYKKIKSFAKIFLIIFLVVAFVVPALPPQTAEAQWLVKDVLNLIENAFTAVATYSETYKEYVLDGIFWVINNIVIRGITQSIVTWINSGFQGSPGFITDFAATMLEQANIEIGNFIYGSDFGFLCSPYQLQIRLALLANRSYRKRALCTLGQIEQNFNNFVTGLNQQLYSVTANGLGAWYNVVTQSPYAQYELARAELEIRLFGRSYRLTQKLNWARGLLEWKEPGCVAEQRALQDEGFGQGDEGKCKTLTPGSVIETRLNETLGLQDQRLVIADEFNEILTALLNQFTIMLLTEASGLLGLGGTNQPGSYIDQLRQEDLFDQERNRVISAQEAQTVVETEERYIAAKETTLARVKQTETLLNSLISCLNGRLNNPLLSESERQSVIADRNAASSTLDSVINPLINRLEGDVENALNIRDSAASVREELNSVTSFDISDTLIRFASLRSSAHVESNVTVAENELSTEIITQLGPIETDASARLAQCQAATPGFNQQGQ